MKGMWLIIAAAAFLALRFLRTRVLPRRKQIGRSAAPRFKPNSAWGRRLVALRGLTAASMRMYFRNRTAIFFSLFFPIMFIVVFGYIFKGSSTSFQIDVTNRSHSALARQFEDTLKKTKAFKITDVSEQAGVNDLSNIPGADLAVVIPEEFGTSQNGQPVQAAIIARYNQAKPQNGQAAALIMGQIASAINDRVNHTPQIVSVKQEGVKTKNLGYIDFLLPGMVGLSIMQLGIFSVAFAFISFKSTGMLRRVQATPTHPSNFLMAQGITRLVIGVLQTALLAFIGVAFFGFHLAVHSWLPFLILALLGSVVFMGFGFAIAGWAKNEDQAAPVANLIQFPMMFLSGTFFPRDSFPHVLKVVTDYFPLTYLADALRRVANDGVGLWAVRGDLLALLIWTVITGAIAVRLFRWE